MGSLDRQVVDNLRGTVGDDAFVDLIEEYILDSSRLVAELQDAAPLHDVKRIREVAHKLKSTALLVGAAALSEVCGELERLAVNGGSTTAVLGRNVAEASRRSAAARTALKRELSRVKR